MSKPHNNRPAKNLTCPVCHQVTGHRCVGFTNGIKSYECCRCNHPVVIDVEKARKRARAEREGRKQLENLSIDELEIRRRQMLKSVRAKIDEAIIARASHLIGGRK